MRRAMLVLAAFALGATAVTAQNVTVIKERQDHLEAIGKAAKPVNAMFKGEDDFDLAKVQAALKVMQEKAAILPTLFPDDSKEGGDTEALPAQPRSGPSHASTDSGTGPSIRPPPRTSSGRSIE